MLRKTPWSRSSSTRCSKLESSGQFQVNAHLAAEEMRSLNSPILETDKAYAVASAKIVWQCFDQEVVVINLESGNYYSLNQTATALWNLLAEGRTMAEVADILLNGAPSTEKQAQVMEFCQRLVQEGLIRATDAPDAARPEVRPAVSQHAGGTWVAPDMTAYSDMQDLFQLDPIHDVDETGWPSRATEET